jgi:hypothetical protein
VINPTNYFIPSVVDRLMRVDRKKLRKALEEALSQAWVSGFQAGDEDRRRSILESLGVIDF